jgi:hypothetical protein
MSDASERRRQRIESGASGRDVVAMRARSYSARDRAVNARPCRHAVGALPAVLGAGSFGARDRRAGRSARASRTRNTVP